MKRINHFKMCKQRVTEPWTYVWDQQGLQSYNNYKMPKLDNKLQQFEPTYNNSQFVFDIKAVI